MDNISENLSYVASDENSSEDISDSLSDSISIDLPVSNIPIDAVVRVVNRTTQQFRINSNELALMSETNKREVHVSISSEDRVINFLQDKPVHRSRTNIHGYRPSYVQATILVVVVMLFVFAFIFFYSYNNY